MKPTCPERFSSPGLPPVLREIPASKPEPLLPDPIAQGTPGEFDLPHGALWATAPRPGLQIRCTDGQLWVTQAGNADDVVLLAGETFTPASRGRVVIQALTHARVGLRAFT